MVSGWEFITAHKRIMLCSALVYIAGVAFVYKQLPRPEQHFDIDSGGYHKTAVHKNDQGNFELPNNPLLHPLGYPAVLAFIYRIFGQNVVWVVIIQAIAAFLSIIAIMLTAFYWYGPRTAWYAFFLALANVGFYIFPQVLLVESFQLFCISWAWERFFYFVLTDNRQSLFISGLFLGVSLLFKPSALHLPLGVLLFLFIAACDKRAFLHRYAFATVLFMGAFAIPVLVIMVRNWAMWGYFSYSFLMEENLFFYFYQQLLSRVQGISENQAWSFFDQLVDKSYSKFDVRYWQGVKTSFFATVLTFWDQAIVIWIQNAIKNCFGLYTRTFVILQQPLLQKKLISFFSADSFLYAIKAQVVAGGLVGVCLAVYECCYSSIRWVLLLVGLGEREKDLFFWLTFLSGFYFLGLLCMTGNGRYRLVFEPLSIVFTAHVLYASSSAILKMKMFRAGRVV